ncbi:MAG: energy coupling factor transporter S component ThiW [Desulfobacterales bacterium]
MHTKKVARAVILTAAAVALSPFFIPVGITKCFPAQHMINVLAAVMLGPAYAVGIAFAAAFLRNILGLGTLLAFPGGMIGAVLVGGTDTRQTSVGALVATVGLVIQNADAQLFNATVRDDLAFGLESLGHPAAAIEERIGATASELGIGPLLDRSPETLSGGEKKITAVAAALCMDPAVMVLDEPFSGLDWHAARGTCWSGLRVAVRT